MGVSGQQSPELDALAILDAAPAPSTHNPLERSISDLEGQPTSAASVALQMELDRVRQALQYADSLANAGDKARAIEVLELTLVSIKEPSMIFFLHGALPRHLTEAGQLKDAREQLELVRTIEDHPILFATIGALYLEEGKVKEGMSRLKLIVDDPNLPAEYRLNVLYNLACGHSLLGENDEAINRLTWALRLDPKLHFQASLDPQLDGIRKDPRFQQLIQQVDRSHEIIEQGLDIPAPGYENGR